MAKNIEATRQELENKLYTLGILEQVINKVEDMIHWDCMEFVTDEDKNPIYDDDGNRVWREVTEEDWGYEDRTRKKVVLEAILKHLEKLI